MNYFLFLYNSREKKKEIFIPFSRHVSFYSCGPTIYDHIHVGNARALVISDVLYRVLILLYGEKNVTFVRNITDIDDKISLLMQKNNLSHANVVQKYGQSYKESCVYLGLLSPTREEYVSKYIQRIIASISVLVKKNYAYVCGNSVFFDVSTFKDYWKLSGRDAGSLEHGIRVEPDVRKKNPYDFFLWKEKDAYDPLTYSSPWGQGRPGWHIECSVIVEENFTVPIDIHGGGRDLLFPHHENERAQTCCSKDVFDIARVWVHHDMVIFDKDKMSKSLGNVVYVKDLYKQYPGNLIRALLLNTHYRKPMLWDLEVTDNYRYLISAINTAYHRFSEFFLYSDVKKEFLPEEFLAFLLDDLDTYSALLFLQAYVKKNDLAYSINRNQCLILLSCAFILGLLPEKNYFCISVSKISSLIQLRNKHRSEKKYREADEVRQFLEDFGVHLCDTHNETYWRIL